jgi:protein-disulfide isomerase
VTFAGLAAWRRAQSSWASWAGLGIRIVLAVVWGLSAASKIKDPRRFVQAVRAYDATPEWLSKAIGYGMPILELSLAVLLLIGLITRYAAAASVLLFVVFIVGIVQASARGIKIECGCFGGGGQSDATAYTLDILRDAGLLVLALFPVIWPLSKFSVDQGIISSEMVPGLSAKQAKSEKNVRRYRAAIAAAENELKHKQRYIAAGTSVAVVLVSLIAIGVQGGRAKIDTSVNTANATIDNGVMVGNQQAPVTVDLYEDLQCPICKNLEADLGKQLAPLVKSTAIKVNYHVISILDRFSNGNRYSSRAGDAGYCAADVSTDAFVKFHDLLFGKDAAGVQVQPAENSNGRGDSDLIRYGKESGITSADFSTCVTSQKHAALVSGVTDAASKRGVTGTPTVFINGTRIEGHNGGPLTAADVIGTINATLKVTKSTAAPSPTPSATSSSAVVPPPTTKPPSTKPKATPTK